MPKPVRPPRKAPAIVIMDDDAEVLLAVTRALVAAMPRALVLPAGSAAEARESIRGSHPDLVIADGRMPGLPAPALAELLRRSRRPPATILLTEHPRIGQADLATHGHAFSAIVSKPVDAHALAAMAVHLLAAAAAHAPASQVV